MNWRIWVGLLVCCAVLPAQALTRTVILDSNPQGARVVVDGMDKGVTPILGLKLEFKTGSSVVATISLDGYQSQQLTMTYEQAKDFRKDHRLPVVELPLVRFTAPVEIRSTVEGAEVSVNGQKAGMSPVSTKLEFRRENGTAPWSSNVVSAVKPPNYAADTQVVTMEQAKAAGAGPLKVELSPGEIRRELRVNLRANETGSEVKVDGVKVGVTPMEHTFVFTRKTAGDPWKLIQLRIENEGFEYAPAGDALPQPAFTMELSADFKSNLIQAMAFKPQGFVVSPVYSYEDRGRTVKVVVSNYISQVKGQIDPDVFAVSKHATNRPLVFTRLSAVPGEPGNVVCSLPIWDERTGAENMPVADRVVGANIVRLTPTGPSPITTGRYFDLDPCVTKDHVYFSSVRADNQRIIWRKRLDGKEGLAPVTGTYTHWDTEPAVSRDELEPKLLFVSRNPEAPGGGTPLIWMAEGDGMRPQQRWEGRSPAWSPDGKKVAYVTPDNRLAAVEVDNNRTVFLTEGENPVLWPAWLSTDEIIYATDKGTSGRGERNFDLWVRNLQSETPVQKTFDGSFDSGPAVGDSGREVFFLSNRGAARPMQEKLMIYRLDLKPAGAASGQ